MNATLPKISVIIPSFNTGKYLAETLASVWKQDYRPLEVLVMDGGSTDDTPRIVEAYGDLVTRFVSEPDRGMLDAVRKGIELATGEICYWLNADDIAMPGAFAYVGALFRDDPTLDIVFGDDYAFDDTKRLYVGGTIRGLTFWDHFLFYRQRYSECVFWRRSISGQAMPLDYSLRLYTDYGFFLPLAYERKSKWVPKRLGAFRSHPNQTSARMRELGAKEPEQVKRAMRERLGMSEEEFRARQRRARHAFFWKHVFYPKAQSGLRFVGRKLTGDYLRKRKARFFFNEWLVPPPEVRARLEEVTRSAATTAAVTNG